MSDISIFAKRTLVLVSKKVAQFSGDIRRSLQITKRAVEMCRDQWLTACEEAEKRNENEKPAYFIVET